MHDMINPLRRVFLISEESIKLDEIILSELIFYMSSYDPQKATGTPHFGPAALAPPNP